MAETSETVLHEFKQTIMKNFNPYIKQLLIFAAFISLTLTSCEEEEGGMPVITNVRLIAKDSSITAGKFGLPIAIQGRNLGSVTTVYFNDVKAKLNPVYVTDTNILLFITDEGPTELNNKITLITASGQTATSDFLVVLPDPVILQLYNEFPKPGTENYVMGRYFFAIEKVLVGDVEVEILEQTPNAIKIVMPDAVGQDRVTVVGAGGTAVSAFRLHETEGNMINFDIPATTWDSDVCWGDAERIDPEDSEIEPVAGRYTRIKQNNLAATGYQGDWVISTCWFDFMLPAAPASAKVMRFEAYIGVPWKAGYYNINIGLESGDQFRYVWKPWDVDAYRASGIKTNGWMTFFIPMDAFNKLDGEKFVSPAVRIPDISKIRDLRVDFSNGGDTASEIPSLYVALDNFRIVDIR